MAGDTRDTQDSVLIFGTRHKQPVVLKVIKQPGDEWHSGKILEAFDGRGIIFAPESTPRRC